MSLFTLDIALYCRECFFNVISRKKISLHQLKLYYLCSSISESLAFNQISRMSYAIRVTELTQVLLVISQWSNVIGQAIWLNKTLDFADVLFCNVKRTYRVIAQWIVSDWLVVLQSTAFLSWKETKQNATCGFSSIIVSSRPRRYCMAYLF